MLSPAHDSRSINLLNRRQALRVGSAALGLSLPAMLRASANPAGGVPKAKSVVVLYLSGGPSQLDMWDMKPEAPREIRGDFRPISTSVPGLQVCEHLPRMAKLADKCVLVRSMSHNDPDHVRANYWMLTGGRLTRPVVQASTMERGDRPHMGAVAAKFLKRASEIPPFVMIPEFVSPVGFARPGQHAGFLGPRYDPYLIAEDPNLPDYSPGAIKEVETLSRSRREGRRELLSSMEGNFLGASASPVTEEFEVYREKAFELISSAKAQRAFDLSEESEKTKDRYGRHVFGQSTLAARRLIEAGARLVQVNFVRHDRGKGGQGYDSHGVPPSPPHLPWLQNELLPPTDAAFSSLVQDLSERGLLDETIVLMMGEFGRTPKFNQYGGRDHWSQSFSLVLAGGGIAVGGAYGRTDSIASTVTRDRVSPEDLLATVYHQLGIDHRLEMLDLQSRPHQPAAGEPVRELIG